MSYSFVQFSDLHSVSTEVKEFVIVILPLKIKEFTAILRSDIIFLNELLPNLRNV